MIERFQGDAGRRILLDELGRQKMLAGVPELAAPVADVGVLCQFAADDIIIQQGDFTNDVFLIIAGVCDVVVNGRRIATRSAGDHVGEMAAVQPTQARSASDGKDMWLSNSFVFAGEKETVYKSNQWKKP